MAKSEALSFFDFDVLEVADFLETEVLEEVSFFAFEVLDVGDFLVLVDLEDVSVTTFLLTFFVLEILSDFELFEVLVVLDFGSFSDILIFFSSFFAIS